jgi:hypothetical protein
LKSETDDGPRVGSPDLDNVNANVGAADTPPDTVRRAFSRIPARPPNFSSSFLDSVEPAGGFSLTRALAHSRVLAATLRTDANMKNPGHKIS